MVRTAILFGGRGPEHEISLQSAATVLSHLPDLCHPLPIYITKDGAWQYYPLGSFQIANNALHSFVPPLPVSLSLEDGALTLGGEDSHPQAVLPLLHGTHGEDGRLAGFLETAGIPFIGCGTLSGAVSMDKAFAKAYLSHFGIPTVPWHRVCLDEPITEERLALVEGSISYPIFVKPAQGGSSLGASCARDREGLRAALSAAHRFDSVALCECCIEGREIEVAILDAATFTVSRPGEIDHRGFYDYRAKYENNGARLLIPAPIPAALAERARRLAERIFRLLGCRHLARVDFFCVGNDLYFNEINTLPGFTQTSMYPRLMADAGYPLPRLLDALIASADARGI